MISSTSFSQEWVTSLQLEFGNKTIDFDSTNKVNPSVVFPSKTYDNSFTIKNNSLVGKSFFIGIGNDIILNKNTITTSLGIGFHKYDYGLTIEKTGEISNIPRDPSLTNLSDQDFWNEITGNESTHFNVSKRTPFLRLALGYKREILRYKSITATFSAGIAIDRRYNVNVKDSLTLEGSYPYVYTNLFSQFNNKQFVFNPYVGIGVRFGSNVLSMKYGAALGRIDDKNGIANFKESFAQFGYARILGLSKIGKEQVIYDEFQHLGLARSSEFRRGDKFSFMTLGFDHKILTNYTLTDPKITEVVFEDDTITKTTLGYSVSPTVNFGLSFNTYATHRWMIGLGLDVYQEHYNSFGNVYDSISGKRTDFMSGDSPAIPTDPYSEYDKATKIAPSISTAIYFSKRILKIDPYFKATSAMVMDYDVPSFLQSNSDWSTKSFFGIHRIGVGVDIRLRIKSSKFLIIGVGADYNLNPHTNYLQYSIRLGYYRKKKLKNQTY